MEVVSDICTRVIGCGRVAVRCSLFRSRPVVSSFDPGPGGPPRRIVSRRRSGPVGRAPGGKRAYTLAGTAGRNLRSVMLTQAGRCRLGVVGSARFPAEGNLQRCIPPFSPRPRRAEAGHTRHPIRRGRPTRPHPDDCTRPGRALLGPLATSTRPRDRGPPTGCPQTGRC